MAQLWIEETDKPVWHRVRRGIDGKYLAECGWLFTPWRGRLWPMKTGEGGPPAETRCHTCVDRMDG